MVITLLLLLIRSNVLPQSFIMMFGFIVSLGSGLVVMGVFLKGRRFSTICPDRKLSVHRLSGNVSQSGARRLPKALVSLARGRSLLLFGLTKPVGLFSWGLLAASLFQIFISIMNGSSSSI